MERAVDLTHCAMERAVDFISTLRGAFLGGPSLTLFHELITALCALFPAFHFDVIKMSLASRVEH